MWHYEIPRECPDANAVHKHEHRHAKTLIHRSSAGIRGCLSYVAPRVLLGASRIDVGARVTSLDPPGNSKAGVTQQRDPVGGAFNQNAAPPPKAAAVLEATASTKQQSAPAAAVCTSETQGVAPRWRVALPLFRDFDIRVAHSAGPAALLLRPEAGRAAIASEQQPASRTPPAPLRCRACGRRRRCDALRRCGRRAARSG
jgi:hypothetical protein